MKIGIYTNLDRDKDLTATKKLAALLKKSGIGFCCHETLSRKIDCNGFSEKDPRGIDIVIALGGDGTVLSAVSFCAQHGIAVLGVNLGKVGFLTEFERDGLESCVECLAGGKYTVSERGMLTAAVGGITADALNEITICRNKAEKSLNFQAYVRGGSVSSFFGDGFVVSTPTGSTAYSLSAGGPIVSADVKCMLLTPLNAHSMFSRSIIVGDNEELTVLFDNQASVLADGKLVGVTDGKVVIKKSERSARFVSCCGKNFYSKLKSKLGSISILPEDF